MPTTFLTPLKLSFLYRNFSSEATQANRRDSAMQFLTAKLFKLTLISLSGIKKYHVTVRYVFLAETCVAWCLRKYVT